MTEYLSLLFGSSWELFSITWPGFDFPISYAFLGVAFASIALTVIGGLFDVRFGSALSGFSGIDQKGGNNRNIKISMDRKNDEK